MRILARKAVIVGSLSLVIAASGAALTKAQQEGVVEKAGEKLDEVGRAIKKGFENAGESVREGFEKTRASIHGMGITARVYGRLHWEKSLHALQLVVKSEAGVVTLRGNVPDEVTHQKAVTVAVDTYGVTKVIDELNVLHVEPSDARRAPDRR